MTAKVFCMASAKGGSGKTVLTATFGTFLAALGKKVLLIDTDAATNGLSLLYFKEVMMRGEFALSEGRKPRGIYELSTGEDTPEIVQLDSKMHLIPATYGFINTETKSPLAYEELLKRVLPNLRESYDYIFLDAQAGSDVYAEVAMKRGISDVVVIVSEYDPMSAAGVERLKGFFREDLTYVRTWVLLNKMLPDFVKSFSDFMEVAKYLSPIPWDAEVVRAYARRRLALNLDEGNEYTLAVMQTIKSLLGDEITKDLTEWSKQKADLIRRPILDQFEKVEHQIEALSEERRRTRSRRLVRLLMPVSLLLSLAVFGWGSFSASSILKDWLAKTVNNNLAASILIAALPFISIFAFIALFGENIVSKFFRSNNEDAQLRRQLSYLESKYRKLRMLAESDLETLLKKDKSLMEDSDRFID